MVDGLKEIRDGLRKPLIVTISGNYLRLNPVISTPLSRSVLYVYSVETFLLHYEPK